MKLVAASIIRNEEKYIETMVRSLSWINQLVIYNDHNDDETLAILNKLASQRDVPKIEVINPLSGKTMLSVLPDGTRDVVNEMQIRNQFLQKVFGNYSPDAVVLIDGDELMSKNLLPFVEKIIADNTFDSIALTCNHIYDEKHYLHVFQAVWNGVKMVDPHVRVLKKFMPYQKGEYSGVPDCFLKPTSKTLCLDIPAHYHLKYIKYLVNPNYSLRFLPENVKDFEKTEYVKVNRFSIPADLRPLVLKYLKN